MLTRTELIPCATCGKPRPVNVAKWNDARRAAKRSCASCGAKHRRRRPPNDQRPPVNVPCGRCGTPRLLQITSPSSLESALKRNCRACALELLPRRHWTISDEPDELVVEFLIAGTKVKATPAERYAAVAYLTERKLSARVIADRLHCTERTVERHRAKMVAA